MFSQMMQSLNILENWGEIQETCLKIDKNGPETR